MNSPTVERKQLLAAELQNRNGTTVDVRQITLGAGQRVGRHLHPCPVVGYISEGTAVYQIEGESTQTLFAGSAFYEPANAVVANFGNASDSNPMTLIAFYLLDCERDLITILEK